jgi:hypothetical protein
MKFKPNLQCRFDRFLFRKRCDGHFSCNVVEVGDVQTVAFEVPYHFPIGDLNVVQDAYYDDDYHEPMQKRYIPGYRCVSWCCDHQQRLLKEVVVWSE